jgi:hypothetical protein
MKTDRCEQARLDDVWRRHRMPRSRFNKTLIPECVLPRSLVASKRGIRCPSFTDGGVTGGLFEVGD